MLLTPISVRSQVFEAIQSADSEADASENENDRVILYVFVGVLVVLFNAIAAALLFQRVISRGEKAQMEDMRKRIAAQAITDEKMQMVLDVLGMKDDANSPKTHTISMKSKADKFNFFLENLKNTQSQASEGRGIATSLSSLALGESGKMDEVRQPVDSSIPTTTAPPAARENFPPWSLKAVDEMETVEDEDTGTSTYYLKADEPVEMDDEEKNAMEETTSNVLQALQIPATDIQIDEYSIARGAFGEIHKGTFRGAVVALKTLLEIDEEALLLFKHEIVLSAQVRSDTWKYYVQRRLTLLVSVLTSLSLSRLRSSSIPT